MLCQRCQNAQATVHIDEVNSFKGAGHSENEVEEHHLCEQCAQEAEIPHIAVQQKTMDEVWKLLQMSAMKAQKKETPKKTLTCVGCGTTLEQLRRKGRVGCQTCYTTFSQYLQGLLERMHGSTHHVGRVPGVNSSAQQNCVTNSTFWPRRMPVAKTTAHLRLPRALRSGSLGVFQRDLPRDFSGPELPWDDKSAPVTEVRESTGWKNRSAT